MQMGEELLENLLQLGRRLHSITRLFGEESIDQVGQGERYFAVHLACRFGMFVTDSLQNRHGLFSPERQPSGGHVIHDAAEAKQITAGIEVLAGRLLR